VCLAHLLQKRHSARFAEVPILLTCETIRAATIVFEMDKGRHPKVVRTWMTGKIRKPPLRPKDAPVAPHKPEPHNKT